MDPEPWLLFLKPALMEGVAAGASEDQDEEELDSADHDDHDEEEDVDSRASRPGTDGLPERGCRVPLLALSEFPLANSLDTTVTLPFAPTNLMLYAAAFRLASASCCPRLHGLAVVPLSVELTPTRAGPAALRRSMRECLSLTW